ncbi:MAG: hypothetical protein CVV05_11190 [Gammaproteobacteria bacterium HGW-Gammaproteobacteria-1]|jgi:hypothetical protein|nr:MAG: hypothetical protein CVV05_11190 [Gammaproteobacteria bacterium HGW-Gammaproteobacteria-1]
MSIPTERRDAGTLFSDLVETLADGSSRLPEAVHPMADLLELSAEQVLARFKDSQQQDFSAVIKELEDPANPLYRMLHELRDIAARQPGNPFPGNRLFASGALQDMFLDLHNHVMDHPVWRHPFFVRVFEGRFTQQQLARFALQYFNQIKNTRQCVALSLGRFSGVMASPYGVLNERLSELTQIVLAQLVADEYGVGSHSVEDYPSMGGLFQSTTHIVMYRQLFDGLGIPFEQQDIPMLPEVADNVLTQRLVAGSEAFTPLESLASVGLGMEWGVPEFFSLLLGGMIRFARDHQVPLTQEHLFVFIAHVRYDVLHAIAVMLVTSFYVREARDIEAVKNATNTLMAGRYGMMTGLYHHVFGESCPTLADIGLDPRYQLRDRRIEDELRRARARVANGTVEQTAAYRSRQDTPYVFAAGV